MFEANTLQEALSKLRQSLPAGWSVTRELLEPAAGLDAFVDVTGPDGRTARLAVEAKNRFVPRMATQVREQLARFARCPGLVVAPFFSVAARELLQANGLNYLDLSGNCRLVLASPGLFVQTVGASKDPSPSEATRRSLRGAKAGRVVRALCDFPLPLSISALATSAEVDVSYASRLVEWLAGEAVLERKPRRAVEAVDRPSLVRRWAQDYDVIKTNASRAYLDPRGLEHVTRRLTQRDGVSLRYAVTGSLAANRLAPTAPARLGMIYVDDFAEAASALQLTSTTSGANVMLLVPFDEVVFKRTIINNNITLVASSQLAVDLLTSPGRSPAEAEAVLDTLQGPVA
jgi:hypothetical protein